MLLQKSRGKEGEKETEEKGKGKKREMGGGRGRESVIGTVKTYVKYIHWSVFFLFFKT